MDSILLILWILTPPCIVNHVIIPPVAEGQEPNGHLQANRHADSTAPFTNTGQLIAEFTPSPTISVPVLPDVPTHLPTLSAQQAFGSLPVLPPPTNSLMASTENLAMISNMEWAASHFGNEGTGGNPNGVPLPVEENGSGASNVDSMDGAPPSLNRDSEGDVDEQPSPPSSVDAGVQEEVSNLLAMGQVDIPFLQSN